MMRERPAQHALLEVRALAVYAAAAGVGHSRTASESHVSLVHPAQLVWRAHAASVPLVKKQTLTGPNVWTAARELLASVASAVSVKTERNRLETGRPALTVLQQLSVLEVHVVERAPRVLSRTRNGQFV